MTPDEFANVMLEAAALGQRDTEDGHKWADAVMITVLRQHGYDEGCDVFETMDKWYA